MSVREGGSANIPAVRTGFLWAWACVATAVLLWTYFGRENQIPAEWGFEQIPRPQLPPQRLVLEAVDYRDLPGWSEDDQRQALPALRRSCVSLQRRPADAEVRPVERGGTVADWLPACAALPVVSADVASVRAYLEEHFQALHVSDGLSDQGTFTGYYEPLLHGSRRRTARYRVPLYANPGDVLRIDLGKFRDEWQGRSIAGRWTGRTLEPYWDRAEIVDGALARRRLELLWVDDPVDAFFLQIQGSGQVELPDGRRIRVGYAGQNGHEYYAIGRELIVRGELERSEVSMQSIRQWLDEHPEDARGVLDTNRSFVFFRELRGDGPLGSQGVALTPERSLAVDRRFHPMGAPIWLEANRPALDSESPDGAVESDTPAGSVPLRRLLVAQDTGGAIRGAVRGDVFWGAGERAAEIAGRMNATGRFWLLLPRSLAERVLASEPSP